MTVKANEEIYFAQDISSYPPTSQGRLNSVPRPSIPNSQQMAAQFYARIANKATETFESFVSNSSPSTLTFGANTASLLSNGSSPPVIREVDNTNTTSGGIFPTSGVKCLLLGYASGTNDNFFSIKFNTVQSAFGFWPQILR